MKSKLLVSIVSVIIALAMVGCTGAMQLPTNFSQPLDGEVLHITSNAVVYGIGQAINNKPGTSIMFDGTSKYIVIWYNTYGASFFGFDVKEASSMLDLAWAVKDGGNLSNVKTANDLFSMLEKIGWAKIDGKNAPDVLKAIASTGTFLPWMLSVASNETVFMFALLPGLLDCNNMPDEGVMYYMLCVEGTPG